MSALEVSSFGDFLLGEWVVQPHLSRITRGDQVERLEPRCIDLLVFLARNPGEVHSRQRLIDEVWRVEAVAENTLTHAIAELRKALGDDARNPSFIETIHRRGYRLLVTPGVVSDEVSSISRTLSHYVLLEHLGGGGMGVVYRAEDTKLGREVALKFLPKAMSHDSDARKRFMREARAASALDHPNICTIHEIDKTPNGQLFIAMAYYGGETLKKKIDRGPLPVDEAIRICGEVAGGLERAHEAGIIHRDIKPANVMVTSDGVTKIVDFGLAKLMRQPQGLETEAPTGTLETSASAVVGTAAYMSPEQAGGKVVDKRTDIWAFGCVFYEMLTGVRPFFGTTSSETLAAIIKDDPDWEVLPAETPAPISRLLRRCLTKDPNDRLHDVADARIVLQSLSIDGFYRDESTPSVPVPTGWRTWLPWGLAAVLAVALIAAAMTGARSDGTPGGSTDVVRTTIELPSGTELTNIAFPHWSAPIRNELALSPDGRTLVFSAATEGGSSTSRLYRRPMDRVEAEVIPGTEGASAPFFSPDGRWIAFWAGGWLKKIPLEGGLPITVAEYRDPTGPYPPMGGSWGADGTIFIGTHLDGLQMVNSSGGQFKPLTVPDRATEYGHRMPQILPGERAVLFTVAYGWSGARGHIEVVSLDTRERKVMADPGLDGRYVPTGHLLFVQQGTVMAAPFDPDQLEVTGRPVPVLEGVVHATNLSGGYANSGAGLLTVSDNGTLVFAAGGMAPDGRRRFVWVNRNGGTQPVSALPEGAVGIPRLSPDGRWLAFATGGLNSSLWVHDFARETNTRLTNEGRLLFLSWAPDGEHIVFGYSRGGVGNLHWLSYRDNEPMERLSTSEYLQQPGSWSPDGRYLAYVQWRHSEGTGIWLLDMDSRKAEPFLDTEHQYDYPDISPNGRWLAYASDETGRDEVWVTSFPGHEQRMLVSNEGGIAPVWSPDGREIYYLSGNRLMVVEAVAGSELSLGIPRTLIEVPRNITGPLRGYDITPDGTQFIFPIDVESEPITPPVRQLQVVLNWFEELKRLVPTD